MRTLNPNSVLWSAVVLFGMGVAGGVMAFWMGATYNHETQQYERQAIDFLGPVLLSLAVWVLIVVLLEGANRLDAKRAQAAELRKVFTP